MPAFFAGHLHNAAAGFRRPLEVIADLHSHYPMHLRPQRPAVVDLRGPGRRQRALETLDGLLIAGAGRLWNAESACSGPRVTVQGLREGGVGVALSVLHLPLLELGERLTVPYRRRPPYGAPPADRYVAALLRQLELVECRIAARHGETARVVRSSQELDACLSGGRLAVVHCVEGGFHLGSTARAVDDAVTRLARRGVAYITLAHLFWRHVATNEPAVPFLTAGAYRRLFPQPDLGLTDLGRAAIRAMVREGIVVDVAHMSVRALDDTFALLDELDPDRTVRVIASHVALRFGTQTYNLTASTVERIAERGGVIGLILAEHQAADGLRRIRTRTFEESFAVLARHIDRMHEITGSHRHTAVGSDLDGFIKPTLAGVANARWLWRLEAALRAGYGEAGDLIASGNVLRLLRTAWGRPGSSRRTPTHAGG